MRTAAYVVPVALAGFFAVASAPAQDYPNRPIRMIVGFPPAAAPT
jgi:tripartite-type tricarboxylate transporter receptor subunit TctC